MKNSTRTAPLLMLLLLSACSSLRETALSTDDVYDVPDRAALAAAAAAKPPAGEKAGTRSGDDYYDPQESARSGASYRDYYDLAYNDPYWYNYGRFGFGTSIGSFGPSYGMGLSYGWPTSFGSMSVGYGMSSGGWGYDPYWSNSWMSGYGYSPYGPYGFGNPYGYYVYGNYGYGYGGYGMGYGPYQSPWGGCYGCYEPIGYQNVVYSQRPSLSPGGAGNTVTGTPRMAVRNPASLLAPEVPARNMPATGGDRSLDRRPERITIPSSPSRQVERQPAERPSRTIDMNNARPSRSTGGNLGGGGRTVSPRPR